MSDRAWVATRKGLFELRLRAGVCQIAATSFRVSRYPCCCHRWPVAARTTVPPGL